MATIVRYKKNGKHYLVLGTGYGQWATARPGLFLGDWSPTREGGATSWIFICDSTGKVFQVRTEDATVVSVDGLPPGEALAGFDDE